MQTKTLSVILSVIIIGVVIELVRQEKLTFKYAAGWLLISLVAMCFSVFDSALFAVARWFGFTLPSNFIFYTLLVIFVFLSLLLTTFLCQQNSRNDIMAQKIGLLQWEVNELKKRLDRK